jgi:hypothetical protein
VDFGINLVGFGEKDLHSIVSMAMIA